MARRKDPENGNESAGADAPQVAQTADVSADDGSHAASAFVAEELAETVPVTPSDSLLSPAAPPNPQRRSGVFGPVLGGALAALGGFGLSHFNVLGFAAPDQTAALAALDQRLTAELGDGLAKVEPGLSAIAALRSDLAALGDRVAAVEATPTAETPDLSRLDARLAAIEALPAGGDASTAAIAAKLAELERRLAEQPAGVDQGQVDAALARLDAAEAEATARAAEAQAAATAAVQTAALNHLRDTIATGAAFEAELAAVADPALAQALQSHVAGVATLADLQTTFPDAARQTLTLARDAAGDQGWGARFVDFLTAQTGARSLTPRDGSDPDAILSRAEFALGEGRLADALTELATLDPALAAPFQDWIARAGARLAVDQAVNAALEGR